MVACGVLVIVAPLTAFVIWKWHLESEIDKQIASLKAAGCPVTGEEFNAFYPTPPSGQNAADLYLKAMETIKQSKSFESKTLPVFSTNSRLFFERLTEAELQESEKALEASRDVFSTIDDAIKFKQCRYPIDLSQGFETLLPHLNGLRQLARFMQLDALVALGKGDSQRAMQDVLKTFAIANSLDKEPTLISKLVQIACYSIGCNTAQAVMCNASPDSVSLRELQAQAYEIEKAFSMKPGMVGEASMHSLYITPDQEAPLLKAYLGGDSILGMIASPFCITKMNMAKVLEDDNKLLEIYSKPLDEELEGGRVFDNDVQKGSKLYFLHRMLLSSLGTAAEKHARFVAQLRAMRTAIAVELYRRDNGHLPERLDLLVPKYIVSIPGDPFAKGQPLKFMSGELECAPMPNDVTQSIVKNGFVVYSVGKDGVGDHAQDCLSPKCKDICFAVFPK